MRTFCGVRPTACATCCLTENGACVLAHTVALPFSTMAVAEWGSIGAFRSDANVLRRETDGLRHLLPDGKRRLRAGPHGSLAVLHDGGSRMGFHRRMRHVAVEVGCFHEYR